MRVLPLALVANLVGACGGPAVAMQSADGAPSDDSTPADAPDPDVAPVDASAPWDAASTGRRLVQWSIFYEEAPSSCAAVGADTIALAYDPAQDAEEDFFDCESGLGLSRPLPLGESLLYLRARSADGRVRLAWTKFDLVEVVPGISGVSVRLRFFDEPERQMMEMYDDAVAAFPVPPLPTSEFPSSVPSALTPAMPCCGQPDNICPPGLGGSEWDIPQWTALGFRVDELSRWQWGYLSSGQGSGASFDVIASSDMDCDGHLARYILHGYVDADGNVVNDGIVKMNEGE